MLESPFSRPEAIAEGRNPTTEPFPCPRVTVDREALLRFHRDAAHDPERAPAKRAFHRRQAALLTGQKASIRARAWDWREFCHRHILPAKTGAAPLT